MYNSIITRKVTLILFVLNMTQGCTYHKSISYVINVKYKGSGMIQNETNIAREGITIGQITGNPNQLTMKIYSKYRISMSDSFIYRQSILGTSYIDVVVKADGRGIDYSDNDTAEIFESNSFKPVDSVRRKKIIKALENVSTDLDSTLR